MIHIIQIRTRCAFITRCSKLFMQILTQNRGGRDCVCVSISTCIFWKLPWLFIALPLQTHTHLRDAEGHTIAWWSASSVLDGAADIVVADGVPNTHAGHRGWSLKLVVGAWITSYSRPTEGCKAHLQGSSRRVRRRWTCRVYLGSVEPRRYLSPLIYTACDRSVWRKIPAVQHSEACSFSARLIDANKGVLKKGRELHCLSAVPLVPSPCVRGMEWRCFGILSCCFSRFFFFPA